MKPPAAPPGRPPGTLLLMAEAALTALTASAVFGLVRLFVDGSFLPTVLLFTVGGHVVAAVCRRRGLSTPASVAIGLLALTATLVWVLLPYTTAWGLPTGATLEEAGRRLTDAWATFTDVVAPAPVEPGFVLAAAASAWLLGMVADTGAFRSGALVEAAVPAASVFLFGAALGAVQYRTASTVLFLAALLAYWLAQRALVTASTPTWMSDDTRAGSAAFLRTGARLGAIGVLAAVVIGPALPGAGASALLPWRASDRNGGGGRVTVSPLVDIRSRIVDQGDVEVFTVRSERPSYWRLTSLETFNGRIWSSHGTYGEADGRLPQSREDAAGDETVEQEFEIENLAAIWLPAAYRPVAIDVAGGAARWDADSGTLLSEAETSDGFRYTVHSSVRSLRADDLAAVGGDGLIDPDIAEPYLALPEDFSEDVGALAREVRGDAATPYEVARRLQDYFRSDDFAYDTTVQAGHGGDDLRRFLFETRRGYCEQFAGAYAAMARFLGLPARVAVGFTPGEKRGDQFVVRGLNGHAWPEVHIDGFGWVAFEPTPGRGIPLAEDYTGVPPQQAGPNGPGASTTTTTTTATTVPPGGRTDPSTGFDFQVGGGGASDLGNDSSPWPRRLLVAVVILVGGAILWVIALALAGRVRRAWRRWRATTPEERVELAWQEAVEALTRARARPRPWETPTEYAVWAAPAVGVDEATLAELAGAKTTATFGPRDVPEDLAVAATTAAGAVERAAGRLGGRNERLRRLVDPRPLLPVRPSRVDIR